MSDPTYAIQIDREVCIGSGVCTVYAAGTFALGDDTKSTVITPSTDGLERIREAAASCPTGAITLRAAGSTS